MSSNILSKVWGALILLLVIVWSFFLGLDVAQAEWRSAIVDGIMLAFWIFLAVFAVSMLIKEAVSDAEFAAHKKELDKGLKDLLNNLTGDMEKLHGDMLSDTLKDIIVDVTGSPGKKPTAKHLTTIAKRFEDETGHTVAMEWKNGKVEAVINTGHTKKNKK